MNLTPREKDKLLISMAAIVARKRLERAKKRAKEGVDVPPAAAAATAAIVQAAGPSPERIAKIAQKLEKALGDTGAGVAALLEQFAKEDTTWKVDVARGACLALNEPTARGNLAEAWAPLIAELAPDGGPPSPYISAALGSLAFALSVGVGTLAIRKDRQEAKPS